MDRAVFVPSDKISSVASDFSNIDALNRRFAISGIAEIASGNNGLPKIRITARNASAEIYLHGAQVTSWHPVGAAETLFLSERSHWQDGRAIRGGIPICFPWFRAKPDNPSAPSHGLVRSKEWQLDSVTAQPDGSVVSEISTESDDSTRQWWPYDFSILQRVTVGAALELTLLVRNTGSTPFSFEEALHTYFNVHNVRDIRVRGLDQVKYLDNTDASREKVQAGDVVLCAATDHAYLNTAGSLDLIDPAFNRTLRTEKQNSATTIVWNPWQQGAAALSDLGDEEWQSMACVEAGNILASSVSLAPGEQHTLRATATVAPA